MPEPLGAQKIPTHRSWPFRLLIFALVLAPLAALAIDPELARFAGVQQRQVREYEKETDQKAPQAVWSFFDAVRVDDWETATNLAARIDRLSGRFPAVDGTATPRDPALSGALWAPVSEMIGANNEFHNWDRKWLHRFGNEIISSIPRGSIYFGGTDPGRFIISVLCESQPEGKPFFTLTQNQLADGSYIEHLRTIYGNKITLPGTNDLSRLFQEYLTDAQARLQKGKLKPGEDVRMVDNRVQVSGQVAVMELNGSLAKFILQHNTNREFYVEESFVLDWMYPHLAPHGPILKLHHQPLATLAPEIVRADQAFWKKLTAEAVGDWITSETSVKKICDFGDKVYRQHDLKDFEGDAAFAADEEAQKAFSKLRSSIAGVYAWRADHASSASEKKNFQQQADLAFRQACAFCPHLPESVFRYANLLMQVNRQEEALLLAKTALRFDPKDAAFQELVRGLSRSR